MIYGGVTLISKIIQSAQVEDFLYKISNKAGPIKEATNIDIATFTGVIMGAGIAHINARASSVRP